MAARQFDSATLKPWVDAQFDRSSGPGGQHVNKVNTRVTLFFDLDNCPLLSDDERRRIRARLAGRLSSDGRVRVVSQRHRSQTANRDAAEHRLAELLTEALAVPKRRRPTRPTAASRHRRLTAKRQRGETKRLRQRPRGADGDR